MGRLKPALDGTPLALVFFLIDDGGAALVAAEYRARAVLRGVVHDDHLLAPPLKRYVKNFFQQLPYRVLLVVARDDYRNRRHRLLQYSRPYKAKGSSINSTGRR